MSDTKKTNPEKEQTENYYHFVKDVVLIAWLIILLSVGILAVRSKASAIIYDLDFPFLGKDDRADKGGEPETPSSTPTSSAPSPTSTSSAPSPTPTSWQSNNCPLPGQSNDETVNPVKELKCYLKDAYKNRDPSLIPPVALVLDRLQTNLSWTQSPQEIDANNGDWNRPTQSDYRAYFQAVISRLEAMSTYSSDADLGRNLVIRNDIVPAIFRRYKDENNKFLEIDIPLPTEAVRWVRQNQLRNKQLNLLDTFILLIMLGGFGSWIYLVRLHLNPKLLLLSSKPPEETAPEITLRDYIYRPMLGMALALAVFVVDVSLHSVVSTAQVEQIRREPLIILAFAAGLISEQAYLYIEGVVRKALEEQDETLKEQNELNGATNGQGHDGNHIGEMLHSGGSNLVDDPNSTQHDPE